MRARLPPCVLLLLAVFLGPGLAVAQQVPAPQAMPGEWVYSVRRGDTLTAIGRVFLASPGDWPRLQQLNRLSPDAQLRTGMPLRIPFAWMRQQPLPAVVSDAGGDGRLERANGTAAPLARGLQIYPGDALVTGAGGSAAVTFADESRLLVAQESRVVFDVLSGFGPTGMVDTRLRLERGRTQQDVTPRRGRFQIWSPGIQTTTRGTEFRTGFEPQSGVGVVEVLESAVDAANALGTQAVDEGFGTSASAIAAPAAPVPLLPAPVADTAGVVRRLPWRLEVAPVAGAAAYRVEVAPDASFSRLLFEGASSTTLFGGMGLADGSYAFRVRAVDAAGIQGRDAVGLVTIDARPEAPFQTLPAENAVVRAGRPAFTWTQPFGADAFRFQLAAGGATTDAFERPLLDVRVPPGATFVPEADLAPGAYRWRVATIDPTGEGPFSDPLPFTLAALSARPELDAPAVMAGEVVVRWATSGPGARYQLQVSASPSFEPVLEERMVDEPTFTFAPAVPGRYYVRVKTIEMDGFHGEFGSAQSFDIVPAPSRSWLPWAAVAAAAAAVLLLLLR